jgi:hypothetical protein
MSLFPTGMVPFYAPPLPLLHAEECAVLAELRRRLEVSKKMMLASKGFGLEQKDKNEVFEKTGGRSRTKRKSEKEEEGKVSGLGYRYEDLDLDLDLEEHDDDQISIESHESMENVDECGQSGAQGEDLRPASSGADLGPSKTNIAKERAEDSSVSSIAVLFV